MMLIPAQTALGRASTESQSWLRPSASCKVVDLTWNDSLRDGREVPARIYLPESDSAPYPVVLFSHGLGGNTSAAEYLGRYLAGHGYVAVHLQHHGSDTLIFRGVVGRGKTLGAAAQSSARLSPAIREAATSSATNVRNAINRVQDVSFAIDTLTRLNTEPGELRGKLDLQRIAIAGHSFGANTAMLCIGQQLPAFASGRNQLADPRIKAALVLSAPAPKRFGSLKPAFAAVKVPVMHMTGTNDDSPIGETTAAERRTAFDNTDAPDQYLVTFQGGDHMIFSGRRVDATREKQDAKYHEWIDAAAGAFFDAYLKNDAAAKSWLKSTAGLETYLGAHARLEEK
jgi:predicted dienelactone hydrolase